LPRLAVDRALGRVRLPLHLNWSQPGREYDLSDRRQRARVYEIVLREGTGQDISDYVDGALLGGLLAGPHPASPTATRMATADRHRPRKHSDLDAARLLTPLQVEATQLFFSLPQSAGFAVAGGAALIVQGLIQRQTRDVDLFLLDAAASTITSAAASFETAIGKRGWSHQRVIDQNDFVRLLITGSRESLIIDLGRDSPAEEPVDATDLGPTLSLRDLAARKTWPCSAAPKPGTSPTFTISPADSAAASSSTGPPTTTQDSTTRSSPTCSPASSGSATRTCQGKPGRRARGRCQHAAGGRRASLAT
jgi:hypothetical protein